MLCSVLNLFVILTHFNGSSMWWNANEVLKNFIQSAFLGSQKQCIWISLMDGVLARYGRQTLAFYTWHRDAWAACFLRGESTNPNPSTSALETPDRSLQLTWFPGIQLLTSHSTTAPLATSVWQEAYQNRSQSERLSKTRVISTWASRNKSIPGFKQKVEFLSWKNWGETSVVFFFFVEVIPFFKPTENPESQKRD